MPAGLATAVGKLYNQMDLTGSADPKVMSSLAGRKHAAAPVRGKGSVGTWKGTPIAVVEAGKDVTLAVKSSTWQVVGGWWPSLGLKDPVLGGVRHVLTIGGDAREVGPLISFHEKAAGRKLTRSHADSLHIIGFDGHGGAGMLDIPRDTYAHLSTGGPKQKINGAMKVAGPEAELQTIHDFTGIPLEGYVLTGFQEFMQLIDLLGPLKIDLPRAVKVTPFPQQASWNLPKGPQVLNGAAALRLARARHWLPDGDFGRTRNQGLIMLSAAAQARAEGPLALPQILTKASPYLITNLRPRDLLTFVANLYAVHPLEVVNKVVKGPAKKVETVGEGGVMERRYVVMLGPTAREVFRDMLDGNLQP